MDNDMMVAMAPPISGKQRTFSFFSEFKPRLSRLRTDPLRRTPNPSRITLALDLNNMYGEAVDFALGVPSGTVDQWEEGALVPSEEEVRRLATLTEFATVWFYEPQDVSAPVVTACGEDGCHVTGTKASPRETHLRLVKRG